MEKDRVYHIPVLLKESVDGLDIRPSGIYVDVTFGGGGHSREILSRLGTKGHLYGFDQDLDAMENALKSKKFTFVRSNFRYLENFLRYYGEEQVDGILADLGVSSHHFDEAERGFSFRSDGPLDMRMNKTASLTAADIVNAMEQEQLANLFRLYGELKNASQIASAIIKARAKKTLQSINDLMDVLTPLMPREREKKDMAKAFQALRIEVNHEMDALKEMLEQAIKVLRPNGRLSVITYHSLEDRIVKNFMKTGNSQGKVIQDFYGRTSCPLRMLGKPLEPSEEEQNINPRSRSAKLRIAQKEPIN